LSYCLAATESSHGGQMYVPTILTGGKSDNNMK
jgi:hypothetical protein